MVAKFRKKPVIVEALQWDPSTKEGVVEMLRFLPNPAFVGDTIQFKTRLGTMTAQRGDWIIKGVGGEFYSCKPNIFEMTYETVEEG